MTRNEIALAAVLAMPLGVLGALAWLTRHPDSALVERAARWPAVGPLAARFRQAYLGAGEHAQPAAEGGAKDRSGPGAEASAPAVAEQGTATGEAFAPGGSAIEAAQARPTVWAPAGTALRASPDEAAPEVARLPVIANLAVAERRGDWVRVRHRSAAGWARLPIPVDDGSPPLGRAAEPTRPLPGQPPDRELLAAGRRLLAGGGVEVGAGPYPLYTDVADPAVLALLDMTARRLEATYRARYGLALVDRPREAVLLFAREGDYRAFQAGAPPVSGLPAAGHTGSGIVALYAERAAPEAVAETLIHELVHLLNRRALGPALPSWLDEGTADDLAHSRLAADGLLETAVLGGSVVRVEERAGTVVVETCGGRAAVEILRRALDEGRAPRLPDLLALDWKQFVGTDRELHYAASALWVRYLLSGMNPRLASGFRSFLADVAAGGSATPEALRRRLGPQWGPEWGDLDLRFRGWLRVIAGDPGPPPSSVAPKAGHERASASSSRQATPPSW